MATSIQSGKLMIDGFQFTHYEWMPGERLLVVQSNRLHQSVEYINAKQVKGVAIAPVSGYDLTDIDFLNDCPDVIAVELGARLSNMEGLYALPNLAYLKVPFQHKISLSRFGSLTDLHTEWNAKVHRELVSLRKLSRLCLRKYRRTSLVDLAALQSLTSLQVIQSPLTSLAGIAAFSNLTALEVSYCRNFSDIDEISAVAGTLKTIEFDHCKRIADFSRLCALKSLQKLMLSDCGSMPNLQFIREMPRLEFFSFVNTHVADGDLSPCLNLRYVGFMDKKRYSHSSKEVRAIIESRGRGMYGDGW